MPRNVIIDIDDTSGQTMFNPKKQTVAVGDLIYWRNNTSTSHKLVLKSNPAVTWIPEIPGKLPDQPAPVSQRGVSFSKATSTDGVDYMCATHPTETGTIIAT